jgi:hypothetical protein
VQLAVTRGRLVIDGGCARVRFDDSAGSRLAVTNKDGQPVSITIGGTSYAAASLAIHAGAGNSIGRLELPDTFCHIIDPAPDDIIEARFSVYVKDLELATDSANDPAPATETYSFLLVDRMVDFSQLSASKQRILKRLAQLRLPNEGTDWVVLDSYALRVEAADTEPEE